MKIILAQPRGFCAGVDRAITIVERAIEIYGAPVYVRHEIVHNKFVVDDLRAKGAIFVEEIEDIPNGSITIFSAHGVSQKVENDAKLRDLNIIDATCPLVKKVHKEAQRSEAKDREIILIGHHGHPEVEGTSGRVKNGVILVQNISDIAKIKARDVNKLAYVTQTTLSVNETRGIIAELTQKFPKIKGPDLRDICYATQNRQDAVSRLAEMVDLLLVVGSKNSSNSNRLRDFGQEIGTTSYLIDGIVDIDPLWLENIDNIGVTAGASAPEILVESVINHIKSLIPQADVQVMDGIEEDIKFKLPTQIANN